MKSLNLKPLSVVLGLAIGLFVGLFVIGTLIRVFGDLLFGWGDSGPMWVSVLIAVATLLSVIVSLRFFCRDSSKSTS